MKTIRAENGQRYTLLLSTRTVFVPTTNGLSERHLFSVEILNVSNMIPVSEGVAIVHPLDLWETTGKGFRLALTRALEGGGFYYEERTKFHTLLTELEKTNEL